MAGPMGRPSRAVLFSGSKERSARNRRGTAPRVIVEKARVSRRLWCGRLHESSTADTQECGLLRYRDNSVALPA